MLYSRNIKIMKWKVFNFNYFKGYDNDEYRRSGIGYFNLNDGETKLVYF